MVRTVNRLFVYGIFLGEKMRQEYGMTNPKYATVPDFITVGGHIVMAAYVKGNSGIALTGLLVDVDPTYWESLDMLEAAYKRIRIETTHGERAWMYVSPAGVPKDEEN